MQVFDNNIPFLRALMGSELAVGVRLFDGKLVLKDIERVSDP